MADLKFLCPECRQRMLVDDSAVGATVDCPSCLSSLIVPANDKAEVRITVRRKLAVLVGNASENVERGEKALSAVIEEAGQLRAETERSRSEMNKLREDLAAAASERDGLRTTFQQTGDELSRLRGAEDRVRSELEEARGQLQKALREGEALREKAEAAAKARGEAAEANIEAKRLREQLEKASAEQKQAADAAVQREREIGARGEAAQREAAELKVSETALRERLYLIEKDRDSMRVQLAGEGEWRQQVSDLHQQLTRFQDQLARIQTERESLRINLGHAEAELQKVRPELESTKNQLELHQRKVQEVGERFAVSERDRLEFQRRLEEPGPVEQLADLQQEFTKLQPRFVEAERQLEELRAKRDQLQTQLAERDEALRRASLTMEAARAELQRSKSEASEGVGEKEQLRGSLIEALEETKELQQRIDGLLDDLHRREDELATAQTKYAEKAASAEAAQKEAEQLRTELDLAAETSARWEADGGAAGGHAHDLEQRVQLLESEACAHSVELQATLEALSAAQVQRDAALSRVTAVESNTRRATAKLWEDAATASEKARDLQGELAALKPEMAQRTREAAAAREAARCSEEERNAALARLDSQEAKLAELREQVERAMATEHTLRVHTGTAERSVASTQEKVRTLESEIQRLQGDVAKVISEVEAAQEQTKQAVQEREVARVAATSMERELEKTLDQLHTSEAQRETVAEELEATRAGLERAKQHVNVLQSRRDQMRDDIGRLRFQLGLAPDPVG